MKIGLMERQVELDLDAKTIPLALLYSYDFSLISPCPTL